MNDFVQHSNFQLSEFTKGVSESTYLNYCILPDDSSSVELYLLTKKGKPASWIDNIFGGG